MVRKEYGAVLRMLNGTIELAAKWEMEDELEGGGEGSPPSDVDEEEADSPPRRRRLPEQSPRTPSRGRPSSSPAATGKALSKITKAYHLVMTLARRVQQTPHAFGGEMEWGVRPATCPTVTQHADDGVPLDTLDDLMDAWRHWRGLVVDPREDGWLEWRASERAASHVTNDSLQQRRGVFEKADDVFNGNFTNDDGATHGLRCGEGPLSGLHLSLPQPAETPEYCDLVRGADGRLSAREPVKYSKVEFAYRLIQFARTMPESMDREIHFYITYVVDLITQMSKYEVKCVVDYDKLVKQKLATGFLTTWNPDMLHATWTRFLQARVEAGQSTTKKTGETAAKEGRGAGKSSGGKATKAMVCFQWNAGKCSKKGCRSAKMASLLLTYLTVWNSVDLSEHGVSLEALREFEGSTVGMGAAVPEVTKFANRWAVVFRDDPAVDDLVRSVSLGAGWKFNPDSLVMLGKNYVKEGFDFKVDKHHQEELDARRVVPVPEGWARAIHGVGVVDKDLPFPHLPLRQPSATTITPHSPPFLVPHPPIVGDPVPPLPSVTLRPLVGTTGFSSSSFVIPFKHPFRSPPPTADPNAPPAVPLPIQDQLALRHAIRQQADEHRLHYQQEYDHTLKPGRQPAFNVGDLVMLRRTTAQRATITTSKIQGCAATGPFIIEELVGKGSVRLRDHLWGQAFPTATRVNMLSLLQARGDSSMQQMEHILLAKQPEFDAAYQAQDKRLEELKAEMRSRPDAPCCGKCKKPCHKLWCKGLCKGM
ncbi:hypothetical protein CYMTET_3642 [Cymbomonas tetramitiformis]|uniref:Uncharacterized protein n=1 Tax=Cymbomonas tetramitiformis TaxID=36881 RepID=A0AAE0LKU7_9CHLO|nr:hypothetical protein CYMTET_3642 [Cymbomonas tetramitiformis]